MSHLTKKDLLKEMNKYVFPNVPLEKSVADILTIKRQQYAPKKLIEWDEPLVNPENNVVTTRRAFHKIETGLEKKREDFVIRRDKLDKNWKSLTEQEQTLKESFIKFNKFIKENHEKQHRASRKLEDEIELQKVHGENLEIVRSQVFELKDIRIRMQEEIKNHLIFEQFLRRVISDSSDFKTDNDVIIRYESLVEAKEELAAKQKKQLDLLEFIRSEMIRISDSKRNEILGIMNQLSHMQNRYDFARIRTSEWEELIIKIRNECIESIKKVVLVKQSAWNLYTNMCYRKESVPGLKENDIENQLLYIKRTMSDLEKILILAKKEMYFLPPENISNDH